MKTYTDESYFLQNMRTISSARVRDVFPPINTQLTIT